MANGSQQSRNPANEGSLAGVFQEILGKFLGNVDDMLPAVITAYDRGTNRATVRPLVRVLLTDGTTFDRAEVDSVPVLQLGGGDVVLSFNIAVGDIGWLKANDRDISLFLEDLASSPPNTIRKHTFSDAVFIPDQFRKWTLPAGAGTDAVLQTLDGTQSIVIKPATISISSDGVINLTRISVGGAGGGTIGATGNIQTFADVIAGFTAISLMNHTHTYDRTTGASAPAETSSSN